MRIIKLVKINNKTRRKRVDYTICLVKKSSHKNRVYEKLGKLSIKGNLLTINVFRLCYWISKKTALSGNVFFILQKNKIFNYNKQPIRNNA